MQRDFAWLLLILAVAFGFRAGPAWKPVFEGGYVNFLETDAWYHVRLIENQVRNWPWRVTRDPYAAPGGQFVPIAPLFDTLTASVARAVYGRDATAEQIERAAALVPPVLGTFTIAALWALALAAFGRSAALIAAALLAVLPGHFFDRTELGFYDHHALEALLAVATLRAIAVALTRGSIVRGGGVTGLVLGLYLLSWSGGAFLVAILGAWLLLAFLLSRADERARAARVTLLSAIVALAFVLVFQDPRMFRYESQVLALVFLAALGLAGAAIASRRANGGQARVTVAAPGVVILIAGGAVLWASATGILQQLITDVGRLRADPTRMAVLEARPLFMYSGVWDWAQPWVFFRSGFYIGLAGLALLTLRVARERRSIDVLIWVTTACMFAATYGQNRFGYYLVPMCALLGGWLGSLAIDWAVEQPEGARSRASQRLRLAVALMAIASMFAAAVTREHLLSAGSGSLPTYWRDAMLWLRGHSDPPFAREAAGDDYYYARYPDASVLPDYTVMNWWDHGYWTIQIARRVPVANPTQERAPNSARFYAATSEGDALAILQAEGSRYVISDWELPFRVAPAGNIMGRFQNVIDWAGGRHADYYEVMYRRAEGGWVPVWVFFEPYYRSMAYRLSVLGGAAASPLPNTTWVIAVEERVDSRGFRFKEILSQTPYATYDAARAAAAQTPRAGRLMVVGLDPWQTAFPLEEMVQLREVYAARTPQQRASESPYVRIFEVVP